MCCRSGSARTAPTWSAMATATTRCSRVTEVFGSGTRTKRPSTLPRPSTGSSAPAAGSANYRDHPAALQPRQRPGERERLELAAAQPEQLGELDLGSHDHLRRRVPARFANRGDTMDAADLLRRLRRRGRCPTTPRGDVADCEADGEQQQRRLDVVGTVDRQVEVRLGVEEVERQRRRDRCHRPGTAAAAEGRQHDDEDEDERDVGVEHHGAKGNEDGGDGDGRGATDCQPEQSRRARFAVVHRPPVYRSPIPRSMTFTPSQRRSAKSQRAVNRDRSREFGGRVGRLGDGRWRLVCH
jgi:hypothetical protein